MLSGAYTIDEAAAHDEIRAAADAFMHEMSWTLRVPTGVVVAEYQESLHRRFSNSAMAHRTSQVASEGSLKVPTRISKPVRERAQAQLSSPMSALLAAVFIRTATDPAAVETSVRAGLRDPAQSVLIELGRRHPDPDDRARAVLLDSGLFPEELGNETAFISDAVRLHAVCCSGGVGAVIRDALSEARSSAGRHGR
jgi:fructuronate reductase